MAALEFCCLWAIAGKVLFCTFSPEKVKTKQNYPKQIKRFEEKPAKLEGLVNGEKKNMKRVMVRDEMCGESAHGFKNGYSGKYSVADTIPLRKRNVRPFASLSG